MGRRDVRRGELFQAAAVRGQRPWDARRVRPPESDAWDGARRDATVDARRAVRQKPDADAGKSAGRVRGGRARDDSQLDARAPLLAC